MWRACGRSIGGVCLPLPLLGKGEEVVVEEVVVKETKKTSAVTAQQNW